MVLYVRDMSGKTSRAVSNGTVVLDLTLNIAFAQPVADQVAFFDEVNFRTLVRHAFRATTDLPIKGGVARWPFLRAALQHWRDAGGVPVTGAEGTYTLIDQEAKIYYETNLHNYVTVALAGHVRCFVTTMVELDLRSGSMGTPRPVSELRKQRADEVAADRERKSAAMRTRRKGEEKWQRARCRGRWRYGPRRFEKETRKVEDAALKAINKRAKEEEARLKKRVKAAGQIVTRRRSDPQGAVAALAELGLPPIVKEFLHRFWILDDAVQDATRGGKGKQADGNNHVTYCECVCAPPLLQRYHPICCSRL